MWWGVGLEGVPKRYDFQVTSNMQVDFIVAYEPDQFSLMLYISKFVGTEAVRLCYGLKTHWAIFFVASCFSRYINAD